MEWGPLVLLMGNPDDIFRDSKTTGRELGFKPVLLVLNPDIILRDSRFQRTCVCVAGVRVGGVVNPYDIFLTQAREKDDILKHAI